MDAENEKSVEKAMDEMLDIIADEIFSLSQENIVRYGAIDTGFMLRSGIVKRDFMQKEIIYSAPYTGIQEFGREPGTMPPTEPIKKWLMRKMHLRESEANDAAWAIARKIASKGTKARPFMRDAINEISVRYGG